MQNGIVSEYIAFDVDVKLVLTQPFSSDPSLVIHNAYNHLRDSPVHNLSMYSTAALVVTKYKQLEIAIS
jgi:hypothetical protein